MTTPANTLTDQQKAGIVDTSSPGVGLLLANYSGVSSDDAVASVGNVDGIGGIGVFGFSAGTATITLTRTADGVTSAVVVTVTGTGGGAFSIALGNAVAR